MVPEFFGNKQMLTTVNSCARALSKKISQSLDELI